MDVVASLLKGGSDPDPEATHENEDNAESPADTEVADTADSSDVGRSGAGKIISPLVRVNP